MRCAPATVIAASALLDSVPVVFVHGRVTSRRLATGHRSAPRKLEHRDEQEQKEEDEDHTGAIHRNSPVLLA